MDAKIEQYILDIVFATRQPKNFGLGDLQPLISYGALPRASINMAHASKAIAMLQKEPTLYPMM